MFMEYPGDIFEVRLSCYILTLLVARWALSASMCWLMFKTLYVIGRGEVIRKPFDFGVGRWYSLV